MNLISLKWETNNEVNFVNVSIDLYNLYQQAKCFKVVTFDPKDDVVDEFSSLASQTAKYAVLIFIFNFSMLVYFKKTSNDFLRRIKKCS